MRIRPRGEEQQRLAELYAIDLDVRELRERFIEPYELGLPITWRGRTLQTDEIAMVTVARTNISADQARSEEDTVETGEEVTNEWIKGAPGYRSEKLPGAGGAGSGGRRVMVVYGRNRAARDAMFTFVRAIGLEPIEWEDAVAETDSGSPHNLEAVRAAMETAQAVIVILTAEDRAGLLPEFAEPGEDTGLRGQPRQNVTLEAGLAMGINQQRTILVRLGSIRDASDFDGLNTVRITNSTETRAALRKRLHKAGCAVSEGSDWIRPETGGDFDVAARLVDETERRQESFAGAENPYAQAARLQRQMRLKHTLSSMERAKRSFSASELATAIGEAGYDEVAAMATLRRLEGEDRVRRDDDGLGWWVVAGSG